MSCVDIASKSLTDSLRSAEFVYSTNKAVKNKFILSGDSEGGIKLVENMIKELNLWEQQLRRLKNAARSCGEGLS